MCLPARDLYLMKLVRYLANLGYGSRREVERLIGEGRVRRADGSVLGAQDTAFHDDLRVDDAPLDPSPGSVLMLHKPIGYVCSTTDAHPVVYALLPDRFRRRSPLMSPIGRLDRDTSGLLLLTDDGQINHRITSPRTHSPKTYEATLTAPLRGDEAALFASGTLLLDSETTPLAPAVLELIDARRVRLTITEGRYHQVRRMFAACGHHVEALHRTAIGALSIGDLASGAWRTLTPDDLGALVTTTAALPRATP